MDSTKVTKIDQMRAFAHAMGFNALTALPSECVLIDAMSGEELTHKGARVMYGPDKDLNMDLHLYSVANASACFNAQRKAKKGETVVAPVTFDIALTRMFEKLDAENRTKNLRSAGIGNPARWRTAAEIGKYASPIDVPILVGTLKVSEEMTKIVGLYTEALDKFFVDHMPTMDKNSSWLALAKQFADGFFMVHNCAPVLGAKMLSRRSVRHGALYSVVANDDFRHARSLIRKDGEEPQNVDLVLGWVYCRLQYLFHVRAPQILEEQAKAELQRRKEEQNKREGAFALALAAAAKKGKPIIVAAPIVAEEPPPEKAEAAAKRAKSKTRRAKPVDVDDVVEQPKSRRKTSRRTANAA